MHILTTPGHSTWKTVGRICFLLLCGYLIWSASAVFGMDTRQDVTIPYWDAKNEEMLAQILPPGGVGLNSKDYLGKEYGRWLYIEYQMGELNFKEVLNYYDHQLKLNDWSLEYANFDGEWPSAHYIRDKSCLNLEVFPNSRMYVVIIWRDYSVQLRIPIVPPYWLLNVAAQIRELQIATCPAKA